jgi:predicted metalloenzyme YecM
MKVNQFLDSLFEQISNVGLDVSGLLLDHVAYQASSSKDYDQVKDNFSNLGKIVSEEVIGGRRVSVFELKKPLSYKNYQIPVLELIEPKESQICESALQHAEFVYENPFEELIKKYPNVDWDTSSMYRIQFAHLKINFDNGLTLKFLQDPILSMFEKEI